MWHAIEARTGRLIHADDGSRYGAYRCPVCKGVVFLRSGQLYSRHFAHRHETAQPECELYTPGGSQFVHPRSPAHFLRDNDREVNGNRGIPSPEVCIEPEESKSRTRRHLPRWKLCITIPKSVDSKGWVTYDFGNSSRRTIALSKLSGGSVTYPADPDAPDFKGLWCSPETSLGYQVSIMQKLPGLSKQGLTSFVSVPGRYKPRAHRLIWGRAYYFVWPKTFDPSFPDELEKLTFDENQDWSCVLSTLPETRNEIIESWLKNSFSVEIEYPSSSWSLLYPFLSSFKYDGHVEVPQVGNLILGCEQTEDSVRTEALTIINGERFELQLPERSRSVVTLTLENDTPEFLYLYGNYQVAFRFRPLDAYDREEQPIVFAEFKSPAHHSIWIPLHTVAARIWLDKVRTGCSQLMQISLPEAVRGELAWRADSSSSWKRIELNYGDNQNRRWLRQVKLAQEELDKIQSVMSSKNDEVKITFKGYGEYYFLNVNKDEKQTIRLPQQLRNRMIWLYKLTSLVHGVGQTDGGNISDCDLIKYFHAMTPPPLYTGHYYTICRTLERLSSVLESRRIG